MGVGGALGLCEKSYLCGRCGIFDILFLFSSLMENHLLFYGLQLGGGPLLETQKQWGHSLWTVTSKNPKQVKTNLISGKKQVLNSCLLERNC